MRMDRRALLESAVLGAGAVGLRALGAGLPLSVFGAPRPALAGSPEGGAPLPQYVLLLTSADGDPVGCNVPGTYADAGMVHPAAPEMAPVPLDLGGAPQRAALPWSRLPPAMLRRTCFFHHATYSVIHSDQQFVMGLSGITTGGEMFPSLLAANLAPRLGTVQAEPVVLGPRDASEVLVFQGNPQPVIATATLGPLLTPPEGRIAMLTALRDRDLDRVHAVLRAAGTPAQAAFIDRYTRAQTQLRSLPPTLVSSLAMLRDDSDATRIAAAVALFRMNLTPVVSLHVRFGGDNHMDYGLMTETQQSVSGIAVLGDIWNALVAADLQDRVTILSLNVFGRTMGTASADGRQHNANHHAALMIGKGFRGSVIGGLEPRELDWGATSIDASTGAAVPGNLGSIPFRETFAAMAHTFGRGIGVPATYLSDNIAGGRPVPAALVDG